MQAPGALELLANGWVSGWAARQADGQASTLTVTLNGQTLTPVTANQARQAGQTTPAPDNAFLAALPQPAPCAGHGPQELRVQWPDGRHLRGSPLRFVPEQPVGRVGGVRNGCLSGWATRRMPGGTPVAVELLVDGLPQLTALANLLRPDLVKLGPAPEAGWRLPLPACVMDGTPHQLRVRALGSEADLTASPLSYQASPKEVREWQLEQALAQAKAMVNAGQVVPALDLLASLQQQYPESGSATLQRAQLAQQNGLLPLALQLFQQIQDGKHRFAAQLGQLQCALQLQRLDEAHQALDALQSCDGNPVQKAWADVQVAAHHSLDTGAQRLQTLLDQQPELQASWHGKLWQWAQGLELPIVPHGHHPALSSQPPLAQWQLAWPLAQALMGQGNKQAARALVQTLPAPPADSDFPRRQAEFWLNAGHMRQAKLCLQHALNQAPTDLGTHDAAQQLHKLAATCHEFDNPAERDALMQRYLAHAPNPQAAVVVNHLASRVREGDSAAAEPGLRQLQDRYPDTPLPAWQARMAREMGQHHATLAHLAPLVQQPLVTLGDARLWILALIDADQTTRAQAELDRLAPLFAPREVLSLQVQLLKLNLEHEQAADRLKSALRCGEHPGLQHQLADLLIALGDQDGAWALIQQALARQPGDWAWAQLWLRWLQEFSHSWTPWFEAARALRPRLGLRPRLQLMQWRIQKLTVTGQFDAAEHQLQHYGRLIDQRVPMSASDRNVQRLQCASLYTPLDRPALAQHWLDRAQSRPLSAPHFHQLCKLQSQLEAVAGRQAERQAQWLQQLPEARHHLALLPPVPMLQEGDLPRTAVLLHLFYPDLWDELLPKLQSLRGTPFRLFITTSLHPADERIRQQAHQLDPQVVFRTVENRGFDVGAHFQSLDHIDLSAFDLVLLLQSKKSKHLRNGHIWRNNVLDDLIGTPTTWRHNLSQFVHQAQLGLIGSARHKGSHDAWTYPAMRQALEALGLPWHHEQIEPIYQYAAGTMFIIRAPLLSQVHQRFKRHAQFKDHAALTVGQRLDFSLGHAMERCFGLAVQRWGHALGWTSQATQARASH